MKKRWRIAGLAILAPSLVGGFGCGADDADDTPDTASDADTLTDTNTDTNTDTGPDCPDSTYTYPAGTGEICDQDSPCVEGTTCNRAYFANYLETYCQANCDQTNANAPANGGCECGDICVAMNPEQTLTWCLGQGLIAMDNLSVKIMDYETTVSEADITPIAPTNITAELGKKTLPLTTAVGQYMTADLFDDGVDLKEDWVVISLLGKEGLSSAWMLQLVFTAQRFVAGDALPPSSIGADAGPDEANYLVLLVFGNINISTGQFNEMWIEGLMTSSDLNLIQIVNAGEPCTAAGADCTKATIIFNLNFFAVRAKSNLP